MNYQVAIIGGGPAGYTAAERAAKAGLSVVLFEKKSLGGVCLNEGCIPTKTLLYTAKVSDTARHASKYAVNVTDVSVDLPRAVSRKGKVVRKLTLGIKARLTACGVRIIEGEAYIADAKTIRCGEETFSCESLLICTGSETVVPPIPGIREIPYWTHRDALGVKKLPSSLAIVGGGVIGMEFASFFHSMGVKVTVIEMTDEILGGMDRELSGMLRAEYTKRGVEFLLSARVTSFSEEDGMVRISVDLTDGTRTVEAEKVLMSAGRRPTTEGFGLENLSLELTERRCIRVDEHMETSVSGVYACGDVNGFSMLAHTAVREAEVAVNHLSGKKDKMSYQAIPGVVYTNPEIASVGASEASLTAENRSYRVIRLPMSYSGRFVAENEGINGLCKALVGDDDTLLGVHLLGNPASELIVMAGMMIEDGRKFSDWKQYVFPHPTVGEIFRELDI